MCETARNGGLRSCRDGGHALAQAGEPPLGMARAQHRVGMAQPRVFALQAALPGGIETAEGLGLPSAQQFDARLRAQRVQLQCRAVGALHRGAQALHLHALQAPLQGGEMPREVVAVRHQQLCGDGWRRRAFVGREFREAEVGLVPDRADHRHGGGRDRARDDLLVEGPQVFQRTAAAREHQHVVAPARGRALQHVDDLRCRACALYLYREHVDLDQRKAPCEHAEHVADRGAAGRGDHADARGECRQRALAVRVEQALGSEARLEFVEGPAQRAFAGFLHVVEHQLVLPARLVQRQPAAPEHAKPLAGLELQPRALGLEHRAADLRARVLDREIQMARGRARHVPEFALDPHRAERAFQHVARQRVELAGREDGGGAFGFHAGRAATAGHGSAGDREGKANAAAGRSGASAFSASP